MKKLLVLFAFVLTMLAGCTGVNRVIPEDGPLIIGMECDYSPFNWSQTTQNDYTLPISGKSGWYADGYDVQIARYLSDELDREVQIVALEWGALITQLRLGMIHLIIAGMSDTEERRESIEFTTGYYEATHVVMLRKDSAYIGGTTLDDFSGAKAVGQVETLYDSLIPQLTGVVHQTPKASVALMTTDIKTGIADIMIVEKPVAQSIMETNSELTFIELTQSFVVDQADKEVAIGINYGNDDILAEINAALNRLSSYERNRMMEAAVSRQAAL